MKISLVTPAGKQSRAGNRTTAARWARILRDFGHQVNISMNDDGDDADMMIAIHAWRSAKSIRAFSQHRPHRPLVVLLAGTDIYKFQHSHTKVTLDAMERATKLIGLHDLVERAIPEKYHRKLTIIRQSSPPLPSPRRPSKRWFEIVVAGHLREEKDPMRAAYAARLLPSTSRLRIVHLGRAHDPGWEKTAVAEVQSNTRYIWRGEVANWEVRKQFSRSHAMLISSIMEGGANIVSEAIVCGVPIIASRIDGNVGMLGEDYPGYYPAEDETALAEILQRSETNSAFLKRLEHSCNKLKPLYTPAGEKEAWQSLLKDLGVQS